MASGSRSGHFSSLHSWQRLSMKHFRQLRKSVRWGEREERGERGERREMGERGRKGREGGKGEKVEKVEKVENKIEEKKKKENQSKTQQEHRNDCRTSILRPQHGQSTSSVCN
jgi:hypothetical protein